MRIRKRRKNNRRQFIIITVSLLVFVFILGTAYSAFSTNLSLNASGEVIHPVIVSLGGVDVEVVTEGDGLYEDSYESGRYAYKGGGVDNYVDIDGEIWRIISVESDGTIKIIKNESIGDMAWYDEFLNDWSTSSLNTYLNNTYTTSALDYAVSHSWNVGGVYKVANKGFGIDYVYDLSTTLSEEQSTTWTGNVAIATVSEFLRADSDETNCGSIGDNFDNADGLVCYDTNWMASVIGDVYGWLLSPGGDFIGYAWSVGTSGNLLTSAVGNSYAVFPVLYLSSSITFDSSTDGSESNPYTIVS